MIRITLRGLYLIAGSGLPVDKAADWLLPGVALVQYRNKNADWGRRHAEAAALRDLCHARGAGFIVNDDPELAARIGADGVHLGKGDGEIAQARHTLGGDAVIGASCYDSLERALEAQRDGANYVAFGSVFASRTKPGAARITLQELANCKRQLALPVCAIGGITRDNLGQVLATGTDLVAVNADIAASLYPVVTVRDYLARIKAGAP